MKSKKIVCTILLAMMVSSSVISPKAATVKNLDSVQVNIDDAYVNVNQEPVLSYKINNIFNGISDYKEISSDIDKVKNLTKGAIVANFKTTSTAVNQAIFSMTDSKNPNSNLYLILQNGKLRYEVRDEGTLKVAFTYQNLILNDGNEHTIILGTGDRGLELYIDGNMVINYTAYRNFFSDVKIPNSMNIGKLVNSSNPQGTWHFNGEISYIDIYDRELTPDEAKKLSKIAIDEEPAVPADYNKLIDLIQSEEEVNMIFTGDSITHGPLHTKGYRSYSEHFNERIRGEEVNGRVKNENFIINTGVSGATSRDILNNFNSVIGTNNPGVVFIMIGMNDCSNNQVPLSEYKSNVKEIVRRVRELGAIPVIQTTNFTKTTGVRGSLPQYMESLRQISREDEVVLIDHYKYWSEELAKNSNIKNTWLNDDLHPNEIGHLEMVKLILRELKLDTEESFTSNLTYPLTTKGAYVDTSTVYPYPEYRGIEEVTPVVSYKVDKEFYSTDYIDKSNGVNKVKDLSQGTIVARFNMITDGMAQTILSLSHSQDPSSNVTLAINGGRLYFEARESGVYTVNGTSSKGGYNDGNWHTAILTSDNEGTRIFVDGEKVFVDPRIGFFNVVQTPDTLNIGKNVHEGGKGEWYYNGAISYVDIYSNTLTEEKALEVSMENGSKVTTIPNIEAITNVIKANEEGTWVFLGDGATSSKGDTFGYKNFVEYFEERVRWEMNDSSMIKRRKFMINSGVDGAKSSDILANFDKWAKVYKPKVVSVMIGGKETVSPEEFDVNLRGIIGKIKDVNAVPLLQTPTIQENDISEYVNVMLKIANEEKIAIIDNYTYWSTIEATQPQIKQSWLNENYEPNHRGHLEISKKMIRDLGITGAGVVNSFNIPYTETTVDGLKDQLQQLVNYAKVLYNAAIEGNKPGEYLQGSKDSLKLSIDLCEKELSRQDSIVAITNSRIKELTIAIKKFNETINPKEDYGVYIDDINEFMKNIKEEDKPYTENSWNKLKDEKVKLERLIELNKREPQDSSVLDGAKDALLNAKNSLVNIVSLSVLIKEFDSIIDSNIYSETSYLVYGNEINKARELLISGTVETVEKAVVDINKAKENLTLVASSDNIKKIITELKKLDSVNYTKNSYKSLMDRVTKIESINLDRMSEEELIEYGNELLNLRNNLIDISELRTAVNRANGINADLYTTSSYDALMESVNKAYEEFTFGSVSSIKTLINDIDNAIKKLDNRVDNKKFENNKPESGENFLENINDKNEECLPKTGGRNSTNVLLIGVILVDAGVAFIYNKKSKLVK